MLCQALYQCWASWFWTEAPSLLLQSYRNWSHHLSHLCGANSLLLTVCLTLTAKFTALLLQQTTAIWELSIQICYGCPLGHCWCSREPIHNALLMLGWDSKSESAPHKLYVISLHGIFCTGPLRLIPVVLLSLWHFQSKSQWLNLAGRLYDRNNIDQRC